MPDDKILTQRLKEESSRLGFQLTGVCPAVTPSGIHQFHEWIRLGYAGEMAYLSARSDAYEHPGNVLPGAKSILMLGMHYRTELPRPTHEGFGRISRYAWGVKDYHDLIHDRLKQIVRYLKEAVPKANARGVVDTAPLLEREFAQLAGLGWTGKHTLLLNREAGSWFFLAAVLTDIVLKYDTVQETDHCGTCTACLDACPTEAFPQPYVLDATRCISYLTIELRAAIPTALRAGIGDWLFGCDICQEVCPWNRKSPQSPEVAFQPRDDMNPVKLQDLFELNDDQFRALFRKTPLWRAKRRGLLRNAAIVLGNQADAGSIPALTRALGDDESLIRGASAWALGQLAAATGVRAALRERLDVETDADVKAEIKSALK